MSDGCHDPEQALFSELNYALDAYRSASRTFEYALAAKIRSSGADFDIQLVRMEWQRRHDAYVEVLERWTGLLRTGMVPEKGKSQLMELQRACSSAA